MMVWVRVSLMSGAIPSAIEKSALQTNESELGRAQFLVELRVAAPGDVQLEGVRRLLDDFVVECASGRERIERRSHAVAQVARVARPRPLLAQLSIRVTKRLPNDGVGSLLAQFCLHGLYERNQDLGLNLCLL